MAPEIICLTWQHDRPQPSALYAKFYTAGTGWESLTQRL